MSSSERERYTHPSFGQISFSRINGRAKFYGSELPQDHYIEMRLNTSEIERDLTQDWYYPKKEIVSVRMTANQFAELITSLNTGGGVCCTIEYIEGRKMEKLPEIENRKEFVHRKFEDRMQEFAKRIKAQRDAAKEIVKKKTLSKDDVRELTQHLDWLTTEITNNIPFFGKCFQETMDEVVTEAKMEVENAIQHKLTTLGKIAYAEEQRKNELNSKKE